MDLVFVHISNGFLDAKGITHGGSCKILIIYIPGSQLKIIKNKKKIKMIGIKRLSPVLETHTNSILLSFDIF